MSARNIYHETVVRALVADGWTITADPFQLPYGNRDLYVDLGAERPTLAAQRGNQRVAIEVQSFLSKSPVRDLEEALGQYTLYRMIMAVLDPTRVLVMAVPRRVYDGILSESIGQLAVTTLRMPLLVFDEVTERVHQWINLTDTERSSGA